MCKIRLIVIVLFLPIIISADGVKVSACGGSLTFRIDIPAYELAQLEDGSTRIHMKGAGGSNIPGYPCLPQLTCTFALPPGTRAQTVFFTGDREKIPGEYVVEAAKPQLPRSGSQDMYQTLNSLYEANYQRVYSGTEQLSPELGRLQSAGERREYSLLTVRINPFYHDPQSRELSVADNLTLAIDYEPVGAEHAGFIQDFLDRGTIHPDVPCEVVNNVQAREWYQPSRRLLATRGMIILTTEELKSLTDSYVSWRENTGFHVTVVSVEEIVDGTDGVDTQQKIRNWLRERVANYEYLLIIGHHWNIPWRTLTLFNDDYAPSWLKYDDYYPHPSDLYYAGLSEPDSLSWNLDGDSYFGETIVTNGSRLPQDASDLDAEFYVGRINSSSEVKVESILESFIDFDENRDAAYKEGSVVVGGILGYYEDGNKWDDSYYMEELLERGIIDRSKAITLYEKEGSNPSEFDCDIPFTQANLVSALSSNDVGLFIESNHGSPTSILRTVWNDWNEDSVPDWGEIESLVAMENSDAPELNVDHPNVSILLSCLCGHPETATCFAQALLNHGSAGVLACTRVAWGAQDDWLEPGDGGDYDLSFYFLDNLYNMSGTYDYVIGDALAQAQNRFWNECSWIGDFCNAYGYNYYGDPSLRLLGRETIEEEPPNETPVTMSIDAGRNVSFNIPNSASVRLEVWDVTGRRIQILFNGSLPPGHHAFPWNTTHLSCGSYFVTLYTNDKTRVAKVVVIR